MMVERPVASKTPLSPANESASDTALAPIEAPTSLDPRPVPLPAPSDRASRWEASHKLARHRAESDRVKVLVEFLSRPVHAHGGAEPDPDIITAYNLAVEAALNGIRWASQSACLYIRTPEGRRANRSRKSQASEVQKPDLGPILIRPTGKVEDQRWGESRLMAPLARGS